MPLPEKKKSEPPKSAKQRIYDALLEWIIDGTLQPGEKIIDSEISDYFSVSRTPVREALQLLADQKLVEIKPSRETRVSEIGAVNIQQVYIMLAELHALAVKFACPAIHEQELKQLKKINAQFAEVSRQKDQNKCREFDKQFHDIFIRLSGNDFLRSFTDTLNCHVARNENQYFKILADQTDSVREHEQIINCLAARDLDGAMQAMRENWLHTIRILYPDQEKKEKSHP
jgi:DNA-binding GntR family transcriptional regulator